MLHPGVREINKCANKIQYINISGTKQPLERMRQKHTPHGTNRSHEDNAEGQTRVSNMSAIWFRERLSAFWGSRSSQRYMEHRSNLFQSTLWLFSNFHIAIENDPFMGDL